MPADATPSLDDDDLTVVRWYECERREPLNSASTTVMAGPVAVTFPGYVCPWDGSHYHSGPVSRRRGSGRRIAAARFHLRKHLEAKDAA